MVFLEKIHISENRTAYKYGPSKDEYIGTIEFDTNSNKDFSKSNATLTFFEGHSFCRATSSALQSVARFVKEGKYPDSYLRATH